MSTLAAPAYPQTTAGWPQYSPSNYTGYNQPNVSYSPDRYQPGLSVAANDATGMAVARQMFGSFNVVPAQQTPPAGPTPSAPPQLTANQQLRQIYAQIHQQDQAANQAIYLSQQAQRTAETAAYLANTANWSAAVYAGNAAMLGTVIAPPKK